MKKFLILALLAVFMISCSKKVEVVGKVTGGSPFERVEFIEASGVGTLPLVNLGLKPDGTFAGSFEAPKSGMYVMSYAGREAMLYLKQGQKLQISFNGQTFPADIKVTGDAQGNNDFLQQTQKFLTDYTSKVDMKQSVMKDENNFMKDIRKIQADLEKNIDDVAAKTKPDSDLITWKKNDIRTGILTIFPQYEMFKKQSGANTSVASFKVIRDYEKSLQEDKDKLVKEHPVYRSYLLSMMMEEFQKFGMTKYANNPSVPASEMFAKFLETKKDLSQTAKDYLLAFMMVRSDIRPGAPKEVNAKITKLINENIKDETVKKDLQQVHFVMSGLRDGEALPAAPLVGQDGKAYDITKTNGRPKLVMMYASWSPYIAQSVIPVVKQVSDFYKSKVDLVAVNFDDSKEQFGKTSKAMLKGIPVTNVYAEGGLTSEFAKKYGVYGFKLVPSFLVVDKNGKVVFETFYNLGEEQFITAMTKVTGLTPPAAPEISLQNDLLAPQNQVPAQPAPQVQPQTAPQTQAPQQP